MEVYIFKNEKHYTVSVVTTRTCWSSSLFRLVSSPVIYLLGIHTHKVNIVQAIHVYKCSQRLRSAGSRQDQQKVAKCAFEECKVRGRTNKTVLLRSV